MPGAGVATRAGTLSDVPFLGRPQRMHAEQVGRTPAGQFEANRFCEAIGFVPLAFRVGGETKARVHTFGQKRYRQDDRDTP